MIFLILTAVFTVSAQTVTVDYKIIGHEVDFMKMQKSIQQEIDKGFVPVGISGYDSKLYLFYLSDNVFPMESWQLSRYVDIESMDDNIAKKIAAGWIPTGFSELDANFYVLYLNSPYKANYYKVKDSIIDSEELKSEFKPFLRTGMIPMDFDIMEDLQVYLSAQMSNMPAKDWKQVVFDFKSETLNDEIVSEMKGRYLPWGFDITEGLLRISFVKFK